MFIKKKMLGIDIYDTKIDDLVSELSHRIKLNRKTIVFGVSSMTFSRFKWRRDLYGLYKMFDIVIAEGAGVPILAYLFGVKISGKIGLVNLSYHLFNLANINNYKVLFFGADQETNVLASTVISYQHPNINFAKGINGYFSEEQIPKIIDAINRESPDILFIGMTYPLKERFAVKYKNYLDVKLIVPCGGAFDVFAGKTKKFKEISRYVPTAWFVRFIQEPFRLFKPIILTMLYALFWAYPLLLFKHIFIERNPDIGKFFNIKVDEEWDIENGRIKE